jgi:hypothetical protein
MKGQGSTPFLLNPLKTYTTPSHKLLHSQLANGHPVESVFQPKGHELFFLEHSFAVVSHSRGSKTSILRHPKANSYTCTVHLRPLIHLNLRPDHFNPCLHINTPTEVLKAKLTLSTPTPTDPITLNRRKIPTRRTSRKIVGEQTLFREMLNGG